VTANLPVLKKQTKLRPAQKGIYAVFKGNGSIARKKKSRQKVAFVRSGALKRAAAGLKPQKRRGSGLGVGTFLEQTQVNSPTKGNRKGVPSIHQFGQFTKKKRVTLGAAAERYERTS